MNKRMLIVVSCSLICIGLVLGGVFYWASQPWAESKLQGYVGRLEDDGYILEERPLTETQAKSALDLYWFSDFRGIARLVNATAIYIDRDRGALYFLDGQNANVFHYTKDVID